MSRAAATFRANACAEVAEHYHHFGGKSPINDQMPRTDCCTANCELDAHGYRLPIYWGNRNWASYLDRRAAADA